MTKDESGEFQYYATDDDYTYVDEGIYWGECIDIKEQSYDEEKDKLYLKFEIFLNENGDADCLNNTDDSELVYLWMSFNIRKPNNSLGKKKLGPRSKYYKTWSFVNGREPSRKAKMCPKIFKNKYFKLSVKTVTIYKDKTKRPESEWYSKVDEILFFTKKNYE